MTKFSIPQTVLSGYRLLAAKPGAALAWFVFQLVVIVGVAALTVAMAGPQLAAMKEMKASGAPDPATAMALSGQIVPFYLVALILAFVTGAILVGAIQRAVLRPGGKAFGYLRFGGDELRLIVLSLVLFVLVGIPFAIAYACGMIGFVTGAGPQTAAAVMQGQAAPPLRAVLIAVAAALPALAVALFLYVKLSLAAPQTVAERAIRIFGSFGLTRGLFWRTLAVYVLTAIPVALLSVAVSAVVVALRGGGDWAMAMQPDTSSMGAAFTVMELVVYVLRALAATINMVALLVPAAMIYRAVAVQPLEAAETDDDDDDDDEED